MLRETECLRADRLGLRPMAARTLSMLSEVRTVLTLPPVVYCRSCGSKLLYPVLDGVAVRNLSVSPNVKMPSEYSLRCYHRVVILNKKFWKELICLLSLHYLKMSFALKPAFAPT
jgi:hypothetical protein